MSFYICLVIRSSFTCVSINSLVGQQSASRHNQILLYTTDVELIYKTTSLPNFDDYKQILQISVSSRWIILSPSSKTLPCSWLWLLPNIYDIHIPSHRSSCFLDLLDDLCEELPFPLLWPPDVLLVDDALAPWLLSDEFSFAGRYLDHLWMRHMFVVSTFALFSDI